MHTCHVLANLVVNIRGKKVSGMALYMFHLDR